MLITSLIRYKLWLKKISRSILNMANSHQLFIGFRAHYSPWMAPLFLSRFIPLFYIEEWPSQICNIQPKAVESLFFSHHYTVYEKMRKLPPDNSLADYIFNWWFLLQDTLSHAYLLVSTHLRGKSLYLDQCWTLRWLEARQTVFGS